MSLCKSGQIANCCHPNALMTLTEFLQDYASDETKEVGYKMIERELDKIPNEKVKAIAKQNIEDIKNSNRRDFRFYYQSTEYILGTFFIILCKSIHRCLR